MQLGWVDFSREDRQKVLDVMNLLQEQGAVDELGIGIVRDAFANYFFPGTSTIQTRAKYFLIVPYLLKEAVDGRFGKELGRVLRAVDEEERQCGLRLMERNPEAEGIIGKRVLPKSWVARKPSDIYWSGIRTYGIFKNGYMSISEYLGLSLKMQERKANVRMGNRGDDTEDSDRDDWDAGDISSLNLWDLPIYHRDWRDEMTIELTKREADYLYAQILKSVPDSLLAFILKNHIDLEPYLDFASLAESIKSDVSSETADLMKLACDFNNLVYMARVRYNVMLSEGQNEAANSEWDWLSEECGNRATVDLPAIFDRLDIYNPKTFAFLSSLQTSFIEGDIEEADRLIRKREVQLKGINRAKLNRTKEHDPDSWVGGGWLDYRFFDARRIVNDIYHGEVFAHV